ncbi:hypothetical protein GJ496_006195 [Pomphorhynchus laevis]|nr:hypothetical protein GJ496_006195 [Pomphorhynchus laevis]
MGARLKCMDYVQDSDGITRCKSTCRPPSMLKKKYHVEEFKVNANLMRGSRVERNLTASVESNVSKEKCDILPTDFQWQQCS